MPNQFICALLSLACFSIQPLLAADSGAVVGKVTFEQLPEEVKPVDTNLTEAQKAKMKALDQTVIWISPRTRPKNPGNRSQTSHRQLLPVPKSVIAKSKQITQGGGDFHPPMMAAIAGQTINLPNNDDIIHSVYSQSRIGPFDLGTYPAGETRAVKFAKPGLAIIRCKLHANMIARIVVVPNHYYAVVTPDQPYRIEGLPAGDYKLSLWRSGFVKRNYELKIEAGKDITLPLTLRSIAASRKTKTSYNDYYIDELIYPYLSHKEETLSPFWQVPSIQLVQLVDSMKINGSATCPTLPTACPLTTPALMKACCQKTAQSKTQ